MPCVSVLRARLRTHSPVCESWPMPPSFFFNHPATTEIYTLSLHDALPILMWLRWPGSTTPVPGERNSATAVRAAPRDGQQRSEEHTSELQSRQYLVCRLLLEKKKTRARADSCSTARSTSCWICTWASRS